LTLSSTNSTALSLSNSATAGSGGAGGKYDSGGDGGAANATSNVSSASGSLSSTLTSAGGAGGAGGEYGSGGNGGAASAASNMSSASGSLSLVLTSTGGAGGSASVALPGGTGGAGGAGGNATGNGTGSTSGDNHSVSVQGNATGGSAGGSNGGLPTGNGGDATMISMAMATGNSAASATSQAAGGSGNLYGAALARASASGVSGSVAATANSGGGIIHSLNVQSNAPLNPSAASTSVAESRASVSQVIPAASVANGLQAAAYGTGLPSAAAVQTFIAGNHPNVQQTFAAANATTLGAVTLGVQSRTDTTTGSGQVFEASFSTMMTTAQLAASNPARDNVAVGLADGSFIGGSGFQKLVLTVTETGGSDSFSQAFTFDEINGGLQAAQTFFHDHVIDLGALPSQDLEVDFDLSLTSTGGGDGFEGSLVFGAVSAVPEPGAWVGGAGAICLLLWGASKRRTRGAFKFLHPEAP
jgi:hypothetical protein